MSRRERLGLAVVLALCASSAAHGFGAADLEAQIRRLIQRHFGGPVQALPASRHCLAYDGSAWVSSQNAAVGTSGRLRVIASGSTLIGANSTVTLVTFTRIQGERVWPSYFLVESDAGVVIDEGDGAVGANGIFLFVERTANANEASLRATNESLLVARTVDWALMGLAP